MLARLIIQNTVSLIIMAALLFLPAGTLRWPNAWVFLIELLISSYAIGFWLLKSDPELLKERLAFPWRQAQKTWDKRLMMIFGVLFLIWLPLMALDSKRHHYFHMPLFLQIIGFFAIALCMYICYLAFKENTYAVPMVRIQVERKHRVIDTGPYRVVRHPMYSGALLFFLGVPLLLTSWLGLLWGLLLSFLLGVRAVFEERDLKNELAGYKDYMSQVRYRFIPYLW
jgi:protein-S-isoprenylcysteine O-methyltransferase Ste14